MKNGQRILVIQQSDDRELFFVMCFAPALQFICLQNELEAFHDAHISRLKSKQFLRLGIKLSCRQAGF